jgi:hypothetical protein
MMRRPSLEAVARDAGIDAATRDRLLAADRADDTEPTPWFVRVLVAVGAWVAAVLFAVMVGLTEAFRHEWIALVLGVVGLVGTTVLRRRVRGDFATQLALALHLGSHLLVAIAVAESVGWRHALAAGAVSGVVTATVALFVYPDRIVRFCAAVTIAAAAAGAFADAGSDHELTQVGIAVIAVLASAATVGLWLAPARLDATLFGELRAPAAYGCALVSLGLLLLPFIDDGDRLLDVRLASWGETGLLVAFGVAALAGLRVRSPEPVVLLLVALGGLGAASAGAPGIPAALLCMGVAFHARQLVLFGITCAFLVAFLTLFYWHLDVSFLAKSGVLGASGAGLLAVYAYLRLRAHVTGRVA